MSTRELLRASIAHTPANPFKESQALQTFEDGGLLIQDGRILAVGSYHEIAAMAPEAAVTDWRGGFIVPGFVDAHVHFPQMRVIGSLGHSLFEWLARVALPEESRMADEAYATDTAQRFVHHLAAHGTTTALVFGAHFETATAALFDAAARAGLRIVSGLVLSDRSLRPELHQSPEEAYQQSTRLIRRYHQHGRLRYAVTPRFAVSASEGMLDVCQTLMREHEHLGFQTHLNENSCEVTDVDRQFPWARDYFGVYERFGLCGPRAVMAHSVWTTAGELERLAASRTAVAHCPCSNAALGSGMFPLRPHIEAGVHVALGTDVGGGTGFSLLKEGLQAYLTQRLMPHGFGLTAAHVLYLATRAGAEALGLDDVGDFRSGQAADFVYIRPGAHDVLGDVLARAGTLDQAVAAIFTLGGREHVREVRVAGSVVFRSAFSDAR
ncbi:MAG: guanine deaminase [Acidobacteriaceae bacterium]|jgi:guanine deaminase|nr:guanine deaminase [Acidobacteriaceae bacterium]